MPIMARSSLPMRFRLPISQKVIDDCVVALEQYEAVDTAIPSADTIIQVDEATGRTIDDVVNDPFVKNEIFGYWKLHKQVRRACEVVDLERQWNAAPRRVRK